MKNLLFILLFSYSSFAVFTLNPNTGRGFNSNKVNVIVSNADCSGAGFSTSQYKAYLEDAVADYWNSVATSAVNVKIGSVDSSYDITGLTFAQALAITPVNTILAGCNQSGAPEFDGGAGAGSSSILGAAQMSCSGSNCRAVLILNSHPTSSVPLLNKRDLGATIAHELGHALGLGHSSSKLNLMYFSVGGKTQTWLGNDDIQGITYLYPHEEKVGCLIGHMFGTIKTDDDIDLQPPFLLVLSFFGTLLFIQMLQLFAIKMKNNFFLFKSS